MLTSTVVNVIDFCLRHARAVVAVGLLMALACAYYAATHFAINSNINALLSDQLDWMQREVAFEREFRRYELIEVVVQAPTPELTSAATTALTHALAEDKSNFKAVSNPSLAQFFAQHGLLFQPKDALEKSLAGMTQAEPLLQDLATDESLRGLIAMLEDVLIGLNQRKLTFDQLARPLNMAADTLENVLAGRPASFSWRVLEEGHPAEPNELRGIIEVRPVLDYADLQPGHAASERLRQIAATIAPQYQATVRLTGPVALSDEEFGTIKENAARNGVITFAIVLVILWLALRSAKLVVALFVNLLVGLPVTAALGLFMVGSFNLISVYFAVLFVGIGVDFAIQYSVRYRSERYGIPDLKQAIRHAGFHVAAPLTLAGCATAAGFFSFLPTNYKGVSELGQIAGFGMLIAFATSVTVLPALISLLNPPGEPEPLGYTSLAPFDNFLARHRVPIIIGVAVVVIGALPLLFWLRFDFNPINLNSPKMEAVAAYKELTSDPSTDANAVAVLAPNLDQAKAIAERVSKLPEVSHAVTLASFIPDDQAEKAPLIENAWNKIKDAFDPKNVQAPPTDAENVDALNEGAGRLTEAAGDQKGAGPDAARRLAAALLALAKASPAERAKAEQAYHSTVARGSGRNAGIAAGAADHTRNPAPRTGQGLDDVGRSRARFDRAQGESERQRRDAPLCERCARGRAQRDRGTDHDPRGRQDGGRRFRRGRHIGAPFDRGSVVGRAASVQRRPIDARTAVDGSRRHFGNLLSDRHAAQFCQYHRVSSAIGRRRRIQNILHHGVARRNDALAPDPPDAGRHLQRADDRHRVRQFGVFLPSRDFEHG